jgi:LAO/AO transport system kinase
MSAGDPGHDGLRELAERAVTGDQRAIAQLLSRVERSLRDAAEVLAAVGEHERSARTIGFVGPPGGGKSSLVAAISSTLASRDQRVAVLAYDPTGYDSRGAILGDRVRMVSLGRDPRIFIRSAGARDPLRTLGATTYPAVEVLARLGFDYVLIEAVGAGQADIGTRHVADTTVLVLAPGAGDDVQAMKLGLTEVADVFVLNKTDLPGAPEALRVLRQSSTMFARSATEARPVIAVSTIDGRGIADLISTFDGRTARTSIAHDELVVEFVTYEFSRRLRAGHAFGPVVSGKVAGIQNSRDVIDVSLGIVDAAFANLV